MNYEPKTYTSEDRHTLGETKMWMIKRPDPWAPSDLGELPLIGELVRIDGELVPVARTEFTYGAFGYCPHIVIFSPFQK